MRHTLSVADFQESVSFLLHTAREVRLSPDTLAHFSRLGARALCPLHDHPHNEHIPYILGLSATARAWHEPR